MLRLGEYSTISLLHRVHWAVQIIWGSIFHNKIKVCRKRQWCIALRANTRTHVERICSCQQHDQYKPGWHIGWISGHKKNRNFQKSHVPKEVSYIIGPVINWHLIPITVKPVYNDHLMGNFSAFWSSSRWPWATSMSSRRQKLLARVNWYLQSSLNPIIELITGNKYYNRGGRYRQVSLYLSIDIDREYCSTLTRDIAWRKTPFK